MKLYQKIICFIFSILFFSNVFCIDLFDPVTWSKSHGSFVYGLGWSHDGKFLAVGGLNASYDLIVYKWDGFSLIDTDPVNNTNKADHGSYGLSVDWTPDGKYLAIGSRDPSNPDLVIYEWNGTSLSDPDPTTNKNKIQYGDSAWEVSWSPDGRYLAVAGKVDSPTSVLDDLTIYEWDRKNVTLTYVESKHFAAAGVLANRADSVAWSPDGRFLAVCGNSDAGAELDDVTVYEWKNLTLTYKAKKTHGTYTRSVAWSPDGKYLAVGGSEDATYAKELIVYGWDGSSLSDLGSGARKDHGVGTGDQGVWHVDWSPDGRYLAVAGDVDSPTSELDDVTIYEWKEENLVFRDKKHHGATTSGRAYFVVWSPYGGYLAVGGENSDEDLIIYRRRGYLDGTKKIRSFGNTFQFINDGIVTGHVGFENGINVAQNRRVTLHIWDILKKEIDLNDLGIIELAGDLHLGTDLSGGIIEGNGYTIFLEHHAMTFSQSVITFSSDTIIDGQGHDLILGYSSQLLVDTDVTLTLRNLRLINTRNGRTFPALKMTDSSSRLTFDNVEFAASDDFYFYNGHMYVQKDFVFTGTHSFIFRSDYPCFIGSKSTMHLEPETTFYYDTVSSQNNNNELIIMQDKTSAIYLNGCTFMLSNTGLKITKGQLFFDNHVIIKNDTTPPPALERGFVWGDHTKGVDYDLDVFILAETDVDIQGYVYYDDAV